MAGWVPRYTPETAVANQVSAIVLYPINPHNRARIYRFPCKLGFILGAAHPTKHGCCRMAASPTLNLLEFITHPCRSETTREPAPNSRMQSSFLQNILFWFGNCHQKLPECCTEKLCDFFLRLFFVNALFYKITFQLKFRSFKTSSRSLFLFGVLSIL